MDSGVEIGSYCNCSASNYWYGQKLTTTKTTITLALFTLTLTLLIENIFIQVFL